MTQTQQTFLSYLGVFIVTLNDELKKVIVRNRPTNEWYVDIYEWYVAKESFCDFLESVTNNG